METKLNHNYPFRKNLKSIYLYPITKSGSTVTYNPYFDDLIQSFSQYYNIINANKPTDKGLFDLLKYIGKIDYLYLNWIEEIIDKRLGFLQLTLLYLLIPYLKFKNIKIIYTLHNKVSHYKKKIFFKRFVFKLLLRNSSFILTHAKEGVDFIEKNNSNAGKRALFFPHPIKVRKKIEANNKPYDILIWGKLTPYKGVHKFLDFLKSEDLLPKYSIKIVGKITDPDYADTLFKYSSDRISITNSFIADDELAKYISQSKIVLFIYNNNSVLSSGVLTDSISYHANVIGPCTGAFLDMKEYGIADTFRDYNDLIKVIDAQLEMDESVIKQRGNKINSFIKSHTWDFFASYINNKI